MVLILGSIIYIYDYNDRHVIATIINSKQEFQKYPSTHTSFETESLGGWSLEGLADYNLSSSITGKQSFNLNGENALYTEASHNKPYILSFWTTCNDFQIVNLNSSSTLKKSAPTNGGFTYYEFELPNILGQVTITGSTTIDELRLYPAVARMTTSTFDPVLGKTSDCDENNRITYYEYDAKGNLQFIKDDHKNIVKMFEYNITPNEITAGCPNNPRVFYNVEVSETFVKNNCEGPFTGTEVTYVVPAETYSSTISQEHADQLAYNEIFDLGQAWANSSSSGSNCIQVFSNPFMSQPFVNENCKDGDDNYPNVFEVGTTVNYEVPAGRYTSTIDQADANAQAQFEIDANGQAYANANGSCTLSYEPVWEPTANTNSPRCNGVYYEYEVQDININSPSYQTVQWVLDNDNPIVACGGTPNRIAITYINNTASAGWVSLKNLADNSVYQFTIDASVTSQISLGDIPPGNYEVTLSMAWGSGASSVQVGNQTQSGGDFYLSSLSLTSPSNPVILIQN